MPPQPGQPGAMDPMASMPMTQMAPMAPMDGGMPPGGCSGCGPGPGQPTFPELGSPPPAFPDLTGGPAPGAPTFPDLTGGAGNMGMTKAGPPQPPYGMGKGADFGKGGMFPPAEASNWGNGKWDDGKGFSDGKGWGGNGWGGDGWSDGKGFDDGKGWGKGWDGG